MDSWRAAAFCTPAGIRGGTSASLVQQIRRAPRLCEHPPSRRQRAQLTVVCPLLSSWPSRSQSRLLESNLAQSAGVPAVGSRGSHERYAMLDETVSFLYGVREFVLTESIQRDFWAQIQKMRLLSGLLDEEINETVSLVLPYV